MITIQPQYIPLTTLLNGRLFRIPDYQRAYSWGTYQRRDLFEDIHKAYAKGPDEGHFMAAVVCLRRDRKQLGTDVYHIMEVVDGQQRLTTLIILLNAIKLKLRASDPGEKRLERELSELLVKVEADELLLLQTNHDSSHHFSTYLRKGTALSSETATTIADKELLLGIEECTTFVNEWMGKKLTLVDLAALLKNRLHFLLHEINEEKTVYTVFEVLNSRGLDVSWLDRLKSILMGAACELKKVDTNRLIKELHVKWRDIYATLGLRQGMNTEALRFAATLKYPSAPSRSTSEEDSVERLRALGTTAKTINEVADWLLQVTKACHDIHSNTRLNAVTRISQARLLAVSILLRDDISKKDKTALFNRWEKVTFRIYGMLRKDARTGVGAYRKLAWRIINEKLSVAAIDSELKSIGKDYPITDAVKALADQDSYEGWADELRYFMFRYEEHLSKKQGLKFSNEQWAKIWIVSPSDSIEHIWAQSGAPSDLKHRLGNLVLLPPRLNSTLQDKAPDEKEDAYRKTGLLIAIDVAERVKKGTWDKAAIENREAELQAWAQTEWAD